MPLSEFDIINHFFNRKKKSRKEVLLGIGDDAALLKTPAKQALAVSMDTLVAGVHFPINTHAYDIGYKALAVNLSDMAAMGAQPAWVTLALTLPSNNKKWLQDFSAGFFKLIDQYNLQLVGGDITRGECLTITVQIHGFVPANNALTRHTAKVGDHIYVTGTLGDAGLALALLRQNKTKISKYLLDRLNCPTPRINEGLTLRKMANSAIDISDGLIADLNHILTASKVGATLWVDQLPLSNHLKQLCKPQAAIEYALCSGDDYELCFTAPARHEKKLYALSKKFSCKLTCIGIIEKAKGLHLVQADGSNLITQKIGFRHF
jgi:thiamine-monophosphate kinase